MTRRVIRSMSQPDPNPKQRAGWHKTRVDQSEQSQPNAPQPKRTPEQWRDLINQRIEEAMQQGEFDNLRGRGKPLNPMPDPHVPPDMQMASALLKNNDLAPAWITDRKAILDAIAHFRARLGTVVAEFRHEVEHAATPHRLDQVRRRWESQQESWRQQVVELNRRIETQNLQQPVTFLEIYKLRLEDELKRAGAPSLGNGS